MRFDEIFTFQPEDDGKVFMCNYSSPAYTQDEYVANDTMKTLEITVQGIPPKYSFKYSWSSDLLIIDIAQWVVL